MNFLRSRAILIIITIMTVLCVLAIGISINISLSIALRKGNGDKKLTPERNQPQNMVSSSDAEPIKVGRLKECTFYFNGKKMTGASAFVSSEGGLYLPIDVILGKLGVKFKYYSSDDILEYTMNREKIKLRLGIKNFIKGGKTVNISTVPITEGNHFHIPLDVLTYFIGFQAYINPDKNSVFLNYWPNLKSKYNSVKAVRLVNGKAQITSLYGNKVYWKSNNIIEGIDSIIPSNSGDQLLIRSNGKLFIASSVKYSHPIKINASYVSQWSLDDRFLYSTSNNKGSLVYDIYKKKTFDLGNIGYKNSVSGSYFSSGILYSYFNKPNINAISMSSPTYNNVYSIFSQNNQVLIEGVMLFSPDKENIIYKLGKDSIFVSSVKNPNFVFIGNGSEAYWINNNTILLNSDTGSYLYSKDGNKKSKCTVSMNLVGLTKSGEVYYTKGKTLYVEAKNQSKKIAKMPYTIDYVYTEANDKPVFAFSIKRDSLLCLYNKHTVKIGKYSSLLYPLSNKDKLILSSNQNFVYSPNGRNIAMLNKSDGFISINKITVKSNEIKQNKIVLDYSINNGPFSVKWISNNVLIAYSPDKTWIIDFRNGVKIHDSTEQSGSVIKSIIIG